MKYEADTPADYLNALDEDWRKEKLIAVRDLMLEAGATETMGYGMLRYVIGDGILAHMNAQKHYLGIYLGDLESIDPGAAIRGKMSCGKTCLRVKKRDDLGVVEQLIEIKASGPLQKLDD